jgi:hypothetical protein
MSIGSTRRMSPSSAGGSAVRNGRWTLLVLMLFGVGAMVACGEDGDASPPTSRRRATTTTTTTLPVPTTTTTLVAPTTQPPPPECRFVTLDELAGIVGTRPLATTVATGGCWYQFSSIIGPPYIIVTHFPGTVGLTAGQPVAELTREATWDDTSETLQVQMPSGVIWVIVNLSQDQGVDPRATAIAVFRVAEGRFP